MFDLFSLQDLRQMVVSMHYKDPILLRFTICLVCSKNKHTHPSLRYKQITRVYRVYRITHFLSFSSLSAACFSCVFVTMF